MRKWVCICILLASALVLAACQKEGAASGRVPNASTGVSEVLAQEMIKSDNREPQASAAPSAKPESAPVPEPTQLLSADGQAADVDLTILSSTMVYSEVYNMLAHQEEYIGKTVKMGGLFDYYHDEAADKYYFACIIQDATACCAQGIEFVLTEEYAYPEDYPQVADEICVLGTFSVYEEAGYTYCTLKDAILL